MNFVLKKTQSKATSIWCLHQKEKITAMSVHAQRSGLLGCAADHL